jgi:hypothetical protein
MISVEEPHARTAGRGGASLGPSRAGPWSPAPVRRAPRALVASWANVRAQVHSQLAIRADRCSPDRNVCPNRG